MGIEPTPVRLGNRFGTFHCMNHRTIIILSVLMLLVGISLAISPHSTWSVSPAYVFDSPHVFKSSPHTSSTTESDLNIQFIGTVPAFKNASSSFRRRFIQRLVHLHSPPTSRTVISGPNLYTGWPVHARNGSTPRIGISGSHPNLAEEHVVFAVQNRSFRPVQLWGTPDSLFTTSYFLTDSGLAKDRRLALFYRPYII